MRCHGAASALASSSSSEPKKRVSFASAITVNEYDPAYFDAKFWPKKTNKNGEIKLKELNLRRCQHKKNPLTRRMLPRSDEDAHGRVPFSSIVQ
uniref:Uncharacterized protein n=1 Tax=Chromera velia CCMP2878 TaxID=1169474 RepID=A0A0G4F064_9ALVE|eukprot:Cvel_2588.t1-p1 / transcript=Cvel_2588.t1 / gene=Cvel_2588 / organism=Chromera_velia_CCMP2878 / gene_product=hypothetical protein / transcript_product=hypothetical protein / location=Cvel_scaffold102:103103-103381(+) / protein_length=93 / sequence_SO=supercontig / SO=protein_coding / is_pseudo=false